MRSQRKEKKIIKEMATRKRREEGEKENQRGTEEKHKRLEAIEPFLPNWVFFDRLGSASWKEEIHHDRADQFILPVSAHREPGHTHHDVQTPLLCPRVLERPHPIAVDIPKGALCWVHAALANTVGAATCRCSLVKQTLLDDGTIHGETVRWWRGWLVRGGSLDQSFQN